MRTIKILSTVIFFVACGRAVAAGAPKYAPVNGTAAVPLVADNDYFRQPGNTAPDYWALAPYYAPQKTGASCSAASAAMAMNALLNARRLRGDEEENFSEEAVAAKAKSFDWSALIGEKGDNGRHGLTLEQLSAGVREALAASGVKEPEVDGVSVSTDSKEALTAFRAALEVNESSGTDIMLIHFVQDALTGAPGGPFAHISPIGAYDAKTRRVLVMDVDRRWYEPYWASDAQVLKAMSIKTKAFGYGGYILIRAGK